MKIRALHWTLFAAFLAFFFWGLNAQYPLLGHDYFYYWPRLLEGKWHFLRQGIAPLRFAPHLCGGFPQYGNPQDLFYSLPQFLSFFLGLWTASQLSILCALLLGYVGWVSFARAALHLPSAWAHTLALVCTATGFHFMHMAAGHLAYFTLPLLSWLLFAVFDARREPGWTLVVRTCMVAIVVATFLYSGTYIAPFIVVPLVLFLLPFDLAVRNEPLTARLFTLGRRFAVFGGASLALGASKLVAVESLMRTLPRAASFFTFTSDQPVLLFALKSLWLFPQLPGFFTLDPNRIHEESMFTSPVALVGSLLLLVLCLRHRALTRAKKFALITYALVIVAIVLALVHGTGILPSAIHTLPLFSSLRVPERFLWILSLLFSIGGVWGLSQLFAEDGKRSARAAVAASAVTVLAFVVAYAPLVRHVESTLPYDQITEALAREPDPLWQPVLRVEDLRGTKASDFHYIFNGSTGSRCYEPMRGEELFPPLKDGPVNFAWDGALNMYNPACMHYGLANGCRPGDRIRIDDLPNLERFINGERTTWKLSRSQVWADRLSLVTFVAIAGFWGWGGMRAFAQRRARNDKPS